MRLRCRGSLPDKRLSRLGGHFRTTDRMDFVSTQPSGSQGASGRRRGAPTSLRGARATKQSILSLRDTMDCFADARNDEASAKIPLRRKRKNGCAINAMLAVQISPQKYSDFQKPQITGISIPVSLSQRGAARDRHGRWERDAVDAMGASDEGAWSRTVKSCGPDASTPASSLAEQHFREATVTRKPDHRGVRRKPLKPLRAGMPGVPVRPW